MEEGGLLFIKMIHEKIDIVKNIANFQGIMSNEGYQNIFSLCWIVSDLWALERIGLFCLLYDLEER